MNLSKMIKYRSIWMALAIIWVMIFHTTLIIPNNYVRFIKGIGYGGVDIFIFAAGIGSYYSLIRILILMNLLKESLKD